MGICVRTSVGSGVGVTVGIQDVRDSLNNPSDEVLVCHSIPPSVFLINEFPVSGAFKYE